MLGNSEEFEKHWRTTLEEASRTGEFVEVPAELSVEDVYPGLTGVELDGAINANWLLDDDAQTDLYDKDTGAELLTRHPYINMDRGDEADVEALSKQMEKQSWVEAYSNA